MESSLPLLTSEMDWLYSEHLPVNGFGAFVLVLYPGAFVDLPEDSLQHLSAGKLLKIYCAGIQDIVDDFLDLQKLTVNCRCLAQLSSRCSLCDYDMDSACVDVSHVLHGEWRSDHQRARGTPQPLKT